MVVAGHSIYNLTEREGD
ncbi:unnamed protein product [Victoria cruziana]